MDHITHEMRRANWKTIIEQCHARPEGTTAKQWLSQQGISEKRYYYWQRRIREDAYTQITGSLPLSEGVSGLTFAEIPLRPAPSAVASQFKPDVVIRSPKVTIELSNSVSDHLLSRILGGLGHAQ